MRPFICIFLLLIATSIEARMYQWVNPTTGRSQLSGKAPSWYRSETGGPRVLVFEKNVLVDDTAVVVGEEQRLQLRGKALPTAFAQKQKALNQEQAVANLEEQIQAIVESPAMEEYLKTSPLVEETVDAVHESNQTTEISSIQKSTTTEVVAESADARVERLKALINAWDKNKTAKAKQLLESGASVKEPLQDL